MSLGTLAISYKDGYIESIDLTKPVTHIGSAYENDIVVFDPSVAPYHIQVLASQAGCQVIDLGTSNGTLLAGLRLLPQVPEPLREHTPLQLGDVTLMLRMPRAGAGRAEKPPTLVPVYGGTNRGEAVSFGTLTLTYPDGFSEQIPITKPTLHVGSAYENDLVLFDESVAPYHAQLLCDGSGCQILDLGSLTGILMSGRRLNPQATEAVRGFSQVKIGNIGMTYIPPEGNRRSRLDDSGWWLTYLRRAVLTLAAIALIVTALITGGGLSQNATAALSGSGLVPGQWLAVGGFGAPRLDAGELPIVPLPPPTAEATPTAGQASTATAQAQTATALAGLPTITPTITPTPDPNAPITIEIGKEYVVTTVNALRLHLREAPSLSAPILARLTPGTVVLAVDGPVPADGYNWVEIRNPDLGGWCVIEALRPRE